MIPTNFVGRQDELELLDELWRSEKANLLILYGRRRVGKTRLQGDSKVRQPLLKQG